MPVGNSDQGVGLSAGDIMISSDILYQFIDWRHDQIDQSEAFDHEGTLSTVMISPKITIGLSDWWNITYMQNIGTRYMGWESNGISKHHREEGADSDFINAKGGYLGDFKLLLRYLALNEGRGTGPRLFLGMGYLWPSKNVLIKSPFLKNNDNEYFEHRHFSMSQGVKKLLYELQFYYKRINNPVFLGASLIIEDPIFEENQFGYSGSRLTALSFTMMNSKNNFLKIPFSINIIYSHEDKAYWNKILAPNSENQIITPGLGFFWKSFSMAFSLNLQYPIFLNPIMGENNVNNLNAESEALQISLSIRKILDYTIPWLYW